MPGRRKPASKLLMPSDLRMVLAMRVGKRRFGDDWPSSDSEDSDYDPGISHVKDDGSDSSTSTEDSEKEEPSGKSKPAKRRRIIKSSAKQSSKASKKSSKSSSRKSKASKTHSGLGREAALPASATVSSGEHSAPATTMGSGGAINVPDLPSEIWLKIFQYTVAAAGALPFLCRMARVCRLWRDLSRDSTLWWKVDLSYGWIKSTEATLKWLADHRLAPCRDLNLSSWKNLKSEWLQYLAERCPNLQAVNVNYCNKLSPPGIRSLASHCSHLSSLSMAFTSAECVSTNCVKSLVEARGSQLKLLELGGNTIGNFSGVLNLIKKHCPNLEVLDFSNLLLLDTKLIHVEKLHRAWPKLRVLRLSNLNVACAEVTQTERESSPGFPALEELSIAMHTCSAGIFSGAGPRVSPTLLHSLCRNALHLRLLDLRGCSSLSSCDLLPIAATTLELLYLARLTVSPDGSLHTLLRRYQHCLVELDVSGQRGDMDSFRHGLRGLASGEGCPDLETLDLSNSDVDEKTLKSVLLQAPRLRSVNLVSCRYLPRGTKRTYRGPLEIKSLKKVLK